MSPAIPESTEGSADVIPTTSQLALMRDELAEQLPHLSITVEMRDGAVCVNALPAT